VLGLSGGLDKGIFGRRGARDILRGGAWNGGGGEGTRNEITRLPQRRTTAFLAGLGDGSLQNPRRRRPTKRTDGAQDAGFFKGPQASPSLLRAALLRAAGFAGPFRWGGGGAIRGAQGGPGASAFWTGRRAPAVGGDELSGGLSLSRALSGRSCWAFFLRGPDQRGWAAGGPLECRFWESGVASVLDRRLGGGPGVGPGAGLPGRRPACGPLTTPSVKAPSGHRRTMRTATGT